MSDREKLIELLTAAAPYALPSNADALHLLLLADELLSRGVTVQKHGRWETIPENSTVERCSVCKDCYIYADFEGDKWHYCPNCGAKMDGEA